MKPLAEHKFFQPVAIFFMKLVDRFDLAGEYAPAVKNSLKEVKERVFPAQLKNGLVLEWTGPSRWFAPLGEMVCGDKIKITKLHYIGIGPSVEPVVDVFEFYHERLKGISETRLHVSDLRYLKKVSV